MKIHNTEMASSRRHFSSPCPCPSSPAEGVSESQHPLPLRRQYLRELVFSLHGLRAPAQGRAFGVNTWSELTRQSARRWPPSEEARTLGTGQRRKGTWVEGPVQPCRACWALTRNRDERKHGGNGCEVLWAPASSWWADGSGQPCTQARRGGGAAGGGGVGEGLPGPLAVYPDAHNATSSETFPGSSQFTDDKLTPTCSRVYSPFRVRPSSVIRTWRCVRTPGTSPKCHRHSLRRAQQEPTCSGPRSRLGRQPLAARTGQQDHGKGLAWPQETPCYRLL